MSLTGVNPVKAKLRQGKVSLGTWMQIGHPMVAEILAQVGFDWIAVDMEHSDMNMRDFTDAARGMYGRGNTPFGPIPLARVRENDTLAIRQVLDSGAWGVIVPLVNSAEEAKRAVQAAKFPPEGIRGTAFFRGNDYGLSFTEYMQHANQEGLVMVMIETKEAVESIEAILQVEGVDGVFIGPYDLSLSYGIPGQLSDPVMREARRKVLEGCRKAKKTAGIHLVQTDKETLGATIREGFTFIGLSMDSLFLDRAARETFQNALGALRDR
ncbi:MAG: aldolase/citrate lyase family protein [Spirochaetales bacterium]